jgi:hypothetical protein
VPEHLGITLMIFFNINSGCRIGYFGDDNITKVKINIFNIDIFVDIGVITFIT